MKTHWYSFLAAIVATLFTTSAQAEEVSRKAVDLMAKTPLVPTNKQSNSSNLVAQNSDANLINSQLPASNYWYLSGSVGGAFPSDLKAENSDVGFSSTLNLDTAFQWSIAGGYQWKDARAELEISNGSFGVNKFSLNNVSIPVSGNVNATTLLVNGYYDIPTGTKFRPYIGAGIGVGFISGKIKDEGTETDLGSGSSFAYQGKLGLQYEVAKKGNAFVEFKYLGISSYKSDAGSDISPPNSYGISVGYRQGF